MGVFKKYKKQTYCNLLIINSGYFPVWKISFSRLENGGFLFNIKMENKIFHFIVYLENNVVLCGK